MGEIAGFNQVAPYLTHPLVLVGFVLLLVFGVHRALLQARIIPKLTPRSGGKVVQNLLHYGFVIALAVILLGFLLAFYRAHLQNNQQVQIAKNLGGALEFCQRVHMLKVEEGALTQLVQACTKAVNAIPQADVSQPRKEDALARLEKGDAQGAKAIFQEVLERKAAEGLAANREAAEAARHLGALAFFENTKDALAAYRKATELDPENPGGWNNLGTLLLIAGHVSDAEAAFGKVKAIAEARGDRKWLASVYLRLADVYRMRGDMAQAEAKCKQASKIFEALNDKDGTADSYDQLGVLYERRGDLGQAEAVGKQAMTIYVALGRKGGMARTYLNLGHVYQRRGELEQAEVMYRESLELYSALGVYIGIAAAYSSLGDVQQSRRNLELATVMYKMSLSINLKLGNQENIAADYTKLGYLHELSREFGQAEVLYQKALAIDKTLGFKQGVANDYTNLGNLYRMRGQLEQAEALYQRSLEINDAIGSKQGMASVYTGLGIVYHSRGELEKAEAMYKKSIVLLKQMGATTNVQEVQRFLDALPEVRTSKAASNRR